MPAGLVTKRSVDELEPAERDLFLWDRQVHGFGLKVTPAGSKSYVLQYRMGGRATPTQRYTIGKHGSPWTPDKARRKAIRLLEDVRRGNDPREANRLRAQICIELAFDLYLKRFLELYGKEHWSRNTYASAESNLRRYVLPILGRRPISEVRRREIVGIFDALPAGKPALARSLFAHTRKLFSWAVERADLEQSPFAGMTSPPAVASRERVLSDRELRLVWLGSYKLDAKYGALVRLLMLLGQRRDEVAGVDWSELDQANRMWIIPGTRTKNGITHDVPLGTGAVAEFDALSPKDRRDPSRTRWPEAGYVLSSASRTPISGFSKAKKMLDQAVAEYARTGGSSPASSIALQQGWRLHDLRRTVATGLQRLGVRFEVTEAVLNHVGGSRSGVAGVYQRHEWKEEKRAALDAWAVHLADVSSSMEGV